jgi:hypothetical protein
MYPCHRDHDHEAWCAPAAADHPHTDPGDGRSECRRCGKWVWPVTHSCKGVPVTAAARDRRALADRRATGCHFDTGLCVCPAPPFAYEGCRAA